MSTIRPLIAVRINDYIRQHERGLITEHERNEGLRRVWLQQAECADCFAIIYTVDGTRCEDCASLV